MEKNEKVYQTLIQQSVEAIYMFDPKTKRVLEVNPAFLKFLGYTAQEAQKLRVYDFVAHDKKSIDKNVQSILKSAGMTIGERLWKRKDGTLIDVRVTAGKIRQKRKEIIFIIARDITERKRAEEQIRYLSFHDKLTGLYNRAYFEEALKRLNTKRQLPLSLIIGDADGLKLVNDGFGHQAGDKMLQKIAQIMKDSCRDEDIVARWGGDEFAVLLPKTKSKDAINICQRIKRSCQKIKEPTPLSLALGRATKNEPGQDIEELLKAAEDKMYRQKSLQSKKTRQLIIAAVEKRQAQHLRKIDRQRYLSKA